MNKKPTLWVQRFPKNKDYAFDFCYHAAIGAKEMGHRVKSFEDVSKIDNDPTNIVVGSVEVCRDWLTTNQYNVPSPIDLDPFTNYLRRRSEIWSVEDVRENLKFNKGPFFVKPANTIKAFTGFVASNLLFFDLFSEGYSGDLIVQEVIDIVSEHRVYVNNNQIVGCKHYLGECLRFPQRHFINMTFNAAKEVLDNHSYCLDFAVLEDGQTVLIEINDGWAVGNYGLDPKTYYLFCRDRWLQITGIRTRMDYRI